MHLPNWRDLSAFMRPTWRLGSIIFRSPSAQPDNYAEIAFLPNVEDNLSGWKIYGDVLEKSIIDGWTRYKSHDIFGIRIHNHLSIDGDAWLGQANHIFNRLRTTSGYEDYLFVNHLRFCLVVSATPQNPPEGYLFVCPTNNLHSGPSSFRLPESPAYWALDPSGTERLSTQEASELGFPAIELTMKTWGEFWDATVYEGVRQFHRAKGFDPESQDVARHLGHPLYQLSSGQDIPFAYVDDPDRDASNGEVESDENTPEATVDEPSDQGEEFRQPEFHFLALDPTSPETGDQEPETIAGHWEILIFLKAALILFLALSWLHEYACGRPL
ncbi:hypothetical protein DFH09DRAFT_1030863 [Mycena vulgaris]|nr:hypothetical protein DFH09DRAFT_1030863 [Mycena vulgaris]